MMENKIEAGDKHEEWQTRGEEIKRKLSFLTKDDLVNAMSRRYDFGTALRRKYGTETERCLLFHILASSTPRLELIDRYDFDGEDSVELFVDSWLKQANP